MKNAEILNKIKVMLGMTVALESMTLDNGTTIEAETFEAGQEIFVLTKGEGEEVEKVPMPQGEYSLEDGRSLVVNAEGLIESIGEAQAEEEEPAPAPAPEEEQEMEAEAPAPAPANPKKVVKQISEEVHFEALAQKDVEIAELKEKIVELSKEDTVEEEPAPAPEVETVQMEAVETEDIVHNPEQKAEKKVNFSKVLKPQTKRQKTYNRLFG